MKKVLLKAADTLNLYPLFRGYTKNTATIFMLHSIYPADDKYGDITAPLLDRYLSFLRKNNYQVVSLADYVRALMERRSTLKCVVFTVDDGYRDFYVHAFEVFRRHKCPATIFLTSDFIEKKLFFWWDKIEYAFQTSGLASLDLDFMGMGEIDLGDFEKRSQIALAVTRYCKGLTNNEKLALIDKLIQMMGVDISGQPAGKYEPLSWDEIREMNKHGIDFYPHTKTHPILTSITKEQKIIEIEEPKKVIEERLGGSADIFCYPNGLWKDFDDETIEILKAAGYIAAVTGVDGFDYVNAPVDLFKLRRFVLPKEESSFKQYVSGMEGFKRNLLSGYRK